MIKYVEKDTSVVFEEIPDEITLAVNISNCKNNCKGCHSPYLKTNIGAELNFEAIDRLIEKNEGITCFCFMGEGNEAESFEKAARYIHEKYPNLMLGVYSGREYVESWYYAIFDYIKIGPYKEEFGPLNKRGTNQKMLMVNHPRTNGIVSDWFIMDITDKFWR